MSGAHAGPIAMRAMVCRMPPSGALCLVVVTEGEQELRFMLSERAGRMLWGTMLAPGESMGTPTREALAELLVDVPARDIAAVLGRKVEPAERGAIDALFDALKPLPGDGFRGFLDAVSDRAGLALLRWAQKTKATRERLASALWDLATVAGGEGRKDDERALTQAAAELRGPEIYPLVEESGMEGRLVG